MVWLNKILRVLVGRRWQRIREEYVELVSGVEEVIIQATHSPLSCIIQIHTIRSHPNPFVEELWDNLLLFRSTKTCFGNLICMKYMTS